MHFFFLWMIFIVSTSSLFPQDNQEKKSLIQDLMDQNIQSTPWDDGEWWDEDDFATFLKKYLISLQNPHPRFKRVSAFKLFKKADSNDCPSVIDDASVWTDLDLFVGRKNKQSYVASKIDRTQTELGKVALYDFFAHPTSSPEIVSKRQAIIKNFAEHDELCSQLASFFQDIAVVEGLLSSLFNQNVLKNASHHCYFQNAFLVKGNESAYALQVRSIFEHIIRSYGVISSSIATIVLFGYGVSQLANIDAPWLDQKAGEYRNDAGYVVRFLWPIFRNRLLRGALALGGSALCAGFTYENAKWEHACTVLELMLQTITIGIAKSMNALIGVSRLVQNYPAIRAWDELAPLFRLQQLVESEEPSIAELFENFSCPTLQGEASIFSFQGRALRAFRLFNDMKDQLVDAMVAGSKLDALIGCARLMKETSGSEACYSFVTFCQHPTPLIHAQGIWHPFIDPQSVVVHDVVLGESDAARNMIITGPNEGGKSTVLKEVAIALIMAQSLGIVPAKKFVITPFSTISTYLTAVDDAGVGNSLFRASAVRAGQLLDRIENAADGNFVFVAFDELFNGTSPHEGEAAAYSLIKEIGASPYVISLVATHFPKLTRLARESDNFVNCKVSVDVQPDGGIEYPYRLEHGISDQHVALHVLQSQGISHRFLDDAIDQLKTQ